MAGDLWWVPSVIVFTVFLLGVAVVVGVLRRRAHARARVIRAQDDELARTAAISLVRADDEVQAAVDELGFAVAQFGERATQDFAAALATSRRQLRDAFALQQKLDDSVPDTDAERRRWNEQLIVLADEATARLRQHTRDFDAKRLLERDAPLKLDQLNRRLDRVAERVKQGETTLERLGMTYTQRALAPISGNAERAQAALVRARAAADRVSEGLAGGPGGSVGDALQVVEQELFHATQLLDAIETGEDQLHIGMSSLMGALEMAEDQLEEARELRDGHEESNTSDQLNRVIVHAGTVLSQLRRSTRLSDPTADLVALREAMDGLDVIRSEARNRQLRLENARTALGGAIIAARSQIGVTRDFITANRARIGAQARTRLAEAERQLALAESEADPVAALDTARRAMTHATDADALARFDAR
jgi:hypothetical protein